MGDPQTQLGSRGWRAGRGEGEGDGDELWGGPYESDSDDELDEVAFTSGDRFVVHMVGLHLENKLTAEDLCTAMFWAAESGMAEARRWALPPGAQSGHYSRKVKTELDDLWNERADVVSERNAWEIARNEVHKFANDVVMFFNSEAGKDVYHQPPIGLQEAIDERRDELSASALCSCSMVSS